jgi:leader peptidase (prepilin peptidase)/N-methyltransferase
VSLTVWYFRVCSGVFGLFIGSFLNVCIYRIPRRKSIAYPPSFCPRCRTPIKFYDNIPVISYLLLRGRCRKCGQPIAARYPAVELLTGLLFFALAVKFGLSWEFLRGLLLTGFLIVLSFIDLERQIIPDVISLPGIGAGLVSSLLVPGAILPQLRGLIPALLGGAVGALLIWGAGWVWLKLARREGMGGGDIRLAALIGTFLGWQQTLFVILLLGPLLGILLGGGAALIRRRRVLGRQIPFGPFLAMGAMVALFAGETLLRWWLR